VHLRARVVAAGRADRSEAAGMRAVGFVFGSPRRLAAAEAIGLPLARALARVGLLGLLPGPLRRWSRARELPLPPARSFRARLGRRRR
jgi:L-lactate dehydrogenase complex protein LldF